MGQRKNHVVVFQGTPSQLEKAKAALQELGFGRIAKYHPARMNHGLKDLMFKDSNTESLFNLTCMGLNEFSKREERYDSKAVISELKQVWESLESIEMTEKISSLVEKFQAPVTKVTVAQGAEPDLSGLTEALETEEIQTVEAEGVGEVITAPTLVLN